MIALRLHGGDLRHIYRVAGCELVCDVAIAELEAFRAGPRAEPPSRPAPAAAPARGPERRSAIAESLSDAGGRRVDFWRDSSGYVLRIAGAGEFRICSRGQRVDLLDPMPGAGGAVVEAALGPALIFALALRGRYCLHAGAIELEGRGIAFLGASGAGKSTLAARLPGLLPDCRRLADDVLPVAARAAGAPRIDPRYPQLKYAPDRQPGAGATSRRLDAICLLEWSASPAAGVAVEPLAGYAATMALVRHTVAARLFTEELLRDHVEWCSRLAEALPIHRLRAPKRWSALPRIASRLEQMPSGPQRTYLSGTSPVPM